MSSFLELKSYLLTRFIGVEAQYLIAGVKAIDAMIPWEGYCYWKKSSANAW